MHPRDISEGVVDPFGKAHERDVVRIYLGSSHDGGNSWHLGAVYANSTLLHTGGAGSFDKGTMLPASHWVTARGRHWCFYFGMNERHDSQFLYGVTGPRLDLLDGGKLPADDMPEWADRLVGIRKRLGVAVFELDRLAGLQT